MAVLGAGLGIAAAAGRWLLRDDRPSTTDAAAEAPLAYADPWAPRPDLPPLLLKPVLLRGPDLEQEPEQALEPEPALEPVAMDADETFVDTLVNFPAIRDDTPAPVEVRDLRPVLEQPVAQAPRPPRKPPPVLEVLGVIGALVLLGLVLAGSSWALAALVGIGVVTAGLWVLAFHPLAVFGAMAFLLGFAPGVEVPVLDVPATVVLALGIWVALAVMPDARHRPGWPVVLSFALIGVALFSVLGNPITSASISDFVRWATATAAVYPLFVLPAEKLAQVGRWFVVGCTAAAAGGITFVAVDPDRGLIMVVGLILALGLLRGLPRIGASAVLVTAVVLTMNQTDAASVALAAILLVVVGGVSGRIRLRLLGLAVVAFLGSISLPAVQSRLGSPFGSSVRDSSARQEALEAMPDQLAGHWFFGRGFGAPELLDPTVANAPLLSVHRGGVVVGVAFTILLIVAAGAAWRLLRRRDLGAAALGAGYLGLLLVAFQFDAAVVALDPATLALALLLAFLGNPDALHTVDEPATATPSFAEKFAASRAGAAEAESLSPAR